MKLNPEQKIKCLLVQPEFSAASFWNYREACEQIDAKYPLPPLGLITLAAILPQHWEFRLLDLNTRPYSQEDWDWSDMICTGGMLPQQAEILQIVRRAKRDNKLAAVGGADPTSQPHVYREADVVVVGEGESAVPVWLTSWRRGIGTGVFTETGKPDLAESPVPRFDLLDFSKYVQIGIQYSRGCPYNCEFCDIIELFGRKPRIKDADQFIAELEALYQLGYSGPVDIADDNFVANKRAVKKHVLPAMIKWNRRRGYPFYYYIEASLNLADDEELLAMMQEADFRIVFIGIESPDPDVLELTNKSLNNRRSIVDRVHAFYRYGMVVAGGFIIGFDGEKPGTGLAMAGLIEDCGINMAMIGLLVALPNTQLTRRLIREGRLLSFKGELITSEDQMFGSAQAEDSILEVVDQTNAGLNFVTIRDRLEILQEYQDVVTKTYEPRAFFDRVLRVASSLQIRSRHRPRWFELRRNLRGFRRVLWSMTRDPSVRWLFWRNFFKTMFLGRHVFEMTLRVMSVYLHFRNQVRLTVASIDDHRTKHSELPSFDEVVARRESDAAESCIKRKNSDDCDRGESTGERPGGEN